METRQIFSMPGSPRATIELPEIGRISLQKSEHKKMNIMLREHRKSMGRISSLSEIID